MIKSHAFRRAGRACLTSVAVTVLVVGGTCAPASAAAVPMTLSAVGGPSGGGNTLVGTVTATAATPSLFAAGSVPTVQFQYTVCGATAKSVTQIAATGTATTAGVLTADPATVKRINGTKIAFKVPSAAYPAIDPGGGQSTVNVDGLALAPGQASGKWYVCVYDSPSVISSTLLATALYTVVPRPLITSITPASSPSAGGQSITVTGAGFTAVTNPITGSIGGVPLENVKVTSNGTSLTAVTGPRAAGTGLALTVTTPAGTVSSLDPDNNSATNDPPIPFTYSNGITISPNTAVSGSQVTVDVTGAGFAQLTFTPNSSPASSQAHVFLVAGAYSPGGNRGVAECDDVVVLDDTELLCNLDLSADQLSPADSATVPNTPIADGAYILTVVANGDPAAGSAAKPSIISSGAVFVVAPY